MRLLNCIRFIIAWVLLLIHGISRRVIWNVAPLVIMAGGGWFIFTCWIEQGVGSINGLLLCACAVALLLAQFLVWVLLVFLCPLDKRHLFTQR